jgi:hypothetical protein
MSAPIIHVDMGRLGGETLRCGILATLAASNLPPRRLLCRGFPRSLGQFAIPLLTCKPLAVDRCRDPTRKGQVGRSARRKGPTFAPQPARGRDPAAP